MTNRNKLKRTLAIKTISLALATSIVSPMVQPLTAFADNPIGNIEDVNATNTGTISSENNLDSSPLRNEVEVLNGDVDLTSVFGTGLNNAEIRNVTNELKLQPAQEHQINFKFTDPSVLGSEINGDAFSGLKEINFGAEGILAPDAFDFISENQKPLEVVEGSEFKELKVNIKQNGNYLVSVKDVAGNERVERFYVDSIDTQAPKGNSIISLESAGQVVKIIPAKDEKMIDHEGKVFENSTSGTNKVYIDVFEGKIDSSNPTKIKSLTKDNLLSTSNTTINITDIGDVNEDKDYHITILSEDLVGNKQDNSQVSKFNLSIRDKQLVLNGILLNEISQWTTQTNDIQNEINTKTNKNTTEADVIRLTNSINSIESDIGTKTAGKEAELSDFEKTNIANIKNQLSTIKGKIEQIVQQKSDALNIINTKVTDILNFTKDKIDSDFTEDFKVQLDVMLNKITTLIGDYPDLSKIKDVDNEVVTSKEQVRNVVNNKIKSKVNLLIDKNLGVITSKQTLLQTEMSKTPVNVDNIINIISDMSSLDSEIKSVAEGYLPTETEEGFNSLNKFNTILTNSKKSAEDITKEIDSKKDRIDATLTSMLSNIDKDIVTLNQVRDIENEIKTLPTGYQSGLNSKLNLIKKSAKVTINFVDENGNKIKSTVLDNTKNGIELGKSYDLFKLNIEGYRMVQLDGKSINPTTDKITIDKTIQEHTLSFKEVKTELEIKYVNETTGEIIYKETQTIDINKKTTVQAKSSNEVELLKDYRITTKSSVSLTPTQEQETVEFKYKSNSEFIVPEGKANITVRHINKDTGEDLVKPAYITHKINDKFKPTPIPFKDYKLVDDQEIGIDVQEGENYITLKYENVVNTNPKGPSLEDYSVLDKYQKEFNYTINFIDSKDGSSIHNSVIDKALYGTEIEAMPIFIEGYTSKEVGKKFVISDIENNNTIRISYDKDQEEVPESPKPESPNPNLPTEEAVKDNWPQLTEDEVNENLAYYKVVFKTDTGKILKVSTKQTIKGKTIILNLPPVMEDMFLIGDSTRTVAIKDNQEVVEVRYRDPSNKNPIETEDSEKLNKDSMEDLLGIGNSNSDKEEAQGDKEEKIESSTNSEDIKDIIEDLVSSDNSENLEAKLPNGETDKVDITKNSNGDFVVTDNNGRPAPEGTKVTLPNGSQVTVGKDGKAIIPTNSSGFLVSIGNTIGGWFGGNTSTETTNSNTVSSGLVSNTEIKEETSDKDTNNKDESLKDKITNFLKPKRPQINIENNNTENNTGNNTENNNDETLNPMLNTKKQVPFLSGDDNGNIRPNDSITREETVTILYRILDPELQKRESANKNNFTDVDNTRWSNEQISTLAKIGIITGVENDKGQVLFRPTDKLTRAEAASILVRFSGQEVDIKDVKFTDTSGHWAEKDIKKASALGWISGYSDNTYKPNQSITRAELTSVINKMLGRNLDNIDATAKFPDVKPTDWFYKQIVSATQGDITQDNNSSNNTWTKMLD